MRTWERANGGLLRNTWYSNAILFVVLFVISYITDGGSSHLTYMASRELNVQHFTFNNQDRMLWTTVVILSDERSFKYNNVHLSLDSMIGHSRSERPSHHSARMLLSFFQLTVIVMVWNAFTWTILRWDMQSDKRFTSQNWNGKSNYCTRTAL